RAAAGARAGRCRGTRRAARIPRERLRAVPHDTRHAGRRPGGAGSHAPREPPQPRGRHPPEHTAAPARLGSRSARDQAGRADAGPGPARARRRGAVRVSRRTAMSTTDTLRGPGDDALAAERRELAAAWSERGGLVGWLTSVDHKSIAKRYIVTALAFFALGGAGALAMRLQLAQPENGLLGPDRYIQVFTTRGTTMMFLFAVPIMEAVGLYFVPLMVGTRNVAYPRLNALGYWTYLI